ncbi:MAG: AAA family ATPase [Phycisphaerae bacterium]|jgi:adenylate kinase|nr:AAA family ATPase [Phycisphaerae bacterium]HOO17595.1 AAA family ATPase [Phycisphaerae bacterium]HPC22425.1 AAA family ATPase [Phycisphaerae bacterium]HRS29209.1 AAA family ATPase [Phycisphaerae bacterium]HRT41703.1 AAA family ATPase [Phycisphaerae bacterium]
MAASFRNGNLFAGTRHENRRVVVTGQVGVDKGPFIDEMARLAESRGDPVRVFHIGQMMYAEAPDVRRGRILDLPLARLNALRRSVFKDVLAQIDTPETVIINTHAAFRWKHGLFPAFDHDQMLDIDADVYVTLVDNADAVHERLMREHDLPHTLKDILVWREEEILATEVLANAIRGHGHFFIYARGNQDAALISLYRLIFRPYMKRVYPSFPMTHVMDMPAVMAEIDAFRATLGEYFITFDPGDMDEKRLLFEAGAATQRGESSFTIKVNGRDLTFSVADVSSVARDIDAQIYARDFKLIDQADMIVTFIPELPDGKPGLSSGVERELQHAWEATKEVYIVWKPSVEPSPFLTETATRIFRTVPEALGYFQEKGYISNFQPPLFPG